MVIGGFMIDISVHSIGNAVVADIHEKKNIFAADGFHKEALAFAGAKAGARCFGKIIVFHITLESRVIFGKIIDRFAKFDEISVNAVCHPDGRFCGDDF